MLLLTLLEVLVTRYGDSVSLKLFDAGLTMLCCGEIMQNLWTVEVSHALHFGTQRSVQPVQEPGASCFRSTQAPGCAVSGGNPVRPFHQTC